jgi:hypothetical protein
VDVAQRGDDIADPFTARFEQPWARMLCWFQAESARAGARLVDRVRHAPSMNFVSVAGSWSADNTRQDAVHGPVYNFVAADQDRLYGDAVQDSALNANDGTNYTFGVEALVKFHALSGTQYVASYGQHDTGTTPVLNWGLRAEDAKLRFISRNSVNTAWLECVTDADVLVQDQWHHVIWWCDGTAAWGFYIDGEAVAKTDTGSFLGSKSTSEYGLAIGAVYDKTNTVWENHLDGEVAFLRLYRTTITAPHAAWLAEGVLAGRDPLRGRIPAGPIPANIPGRHWVGEDSDWFTAANWSRAAGGLRGAGVPDCEKPVYFDAERASYE